MDSDIKHSDENASPSASGVEVSRSAEHMSSDPAIDVERGLLVLNKLRNDSPDVAAGWVLQQGQLLRTASAEDLGTSDLYHLAGAQGLAPLAERQAMVQNVIRGLTHLSTEERREVMDLGRDVWLLSRTADTKVGDEQASQTPAPSAALLPNLVVVGRAASAQPVPQEELAALAQTAKDEMLLDMIEEPTLLSSALSELDESQRAQLQETLLQSNVVPEEHHATVARTLQKGGYVDQLSWSLRLIKRVHASRQLFVLFPLLELTFACAIRYYSWCGGALANQWLALDALMHLFTTWWIYELFRYLAPLYDRLQKDPLGTVQSVQNAFQVSSDEERNEVLGLHEGGIQGARFSAGAVSLLLALGSLWAVMGLLFMLLATAEQACAVLSYLIILVFLACRVYTLVCVYSLVSHVWSEASLVPGLAMGPSYGSTDKSEHASSVPAPEQKQTV